MQAYISISGSLTELERDAGVASLLSGPRCGSNRKDVGKSKEEAYKEAAKAIALLTSTRQVKHRLIHLLMKKGLDNAISRYCAYEKLPKVYQTVCRSADCVETLVRGMLYKVCRLEKHAALDAKIGEMAASLRENRDNLSAYDRVSIVQQFIHHRVDIALGEGAHTSLPVHHMQNSLSACRLHLLIIDLQSKHEAYAVYMEELSRIATNLERDRIESGSDAMADRVSPYWRIRHLKTLTHFIESGSRKRITRLREIDEDLPLEEFRREALGIYAS